MSLKYCHKCNKNIDLDIEEHFEHFQLNNNGGKIKMTEGRTGVEDTIAEPKEEVKEEEKKEESESSETPEEKKE